MSRRRQTGAVRGPASALTSFLAGLGVEPAQRLTTWGDSSAISGDTPSLAPDGPVLLGNTLDPAGAVTADTVIAGPSQAGEGSPSRKRSSSIDSNDLDAVHPKPERQVDTGPLKAVGQFMQCGECGNRFTVTAYTKEHPSSPLTWLCVKCCTVLGIDPFGKAKRPPKKKAKEERAKVVHYEDRKGVHLLGDLCIRMIGRCIEDVEQLGEIGHINMDKVCKIISKSRRLTPQTAPLFYGGDRKDLTLYDCTLLDQSSYMAMPRLCPNLTSLHLHLCGQMTTESLMALGQLPLKRIELLGPFLVRKEGWISFFKSAPLESFLLTQSPRLDLEAVQTLVEYCPNLSELRLAEIGLLTDEFLAPIAALNLTLLDLSSGPLTDLAVSKLLSSVGKNLLSLNLSDNPDLSDEILGDIARCPRLRSLALRNLDLTDDGVARFFQQAASPGFEMLDLEKGHDLKGSALQALVQHSGTTVEHLNLLGWREVDTESLGDLAKCLHLKEVNLGWCRQVTDFSIKDILDACEVISVIKVWGCNQLSDAVPRRKGVRVVGIETHAI